MNTTANESVRPRSCPAEGVVPAFDAGWYAHEIGLDRETVEMLAADPEWSLLGWNARRSAAAVPKDEERDDG